jgi:hypothetical protein
MVISVRDAAVRKNFYRRTRPGTGETIYDVEWSLGELKRVALPVIAKLPELWRLEEEYKGRVGQYWRTCVVLREICTDAAGGGGRPTVRL